MVERENNFVQDCLWNTSVKDRFAGSLFLVLWARGRSSFRVRIIYCVSRLFGRWLRATLSCDERMTWKLMIFCERRGRKAKALLMSEVTKVSGWTPAPGSGNKRMSESGTWFRGESGDEQRLSRSFEVIVLAITFIPLFPYPPSSPTKQGLTVD